MSSCRQLLLVLGACAIPTGSAFAQTGTPLDDDRVDLNQPVITPETREDAPPPVDDTALSSVEAGEANAAPIQSIQFVGTDVPQVVGLAAEEFIGVPATRAKGHGTKTKRADDKTRAAHGAKVGQGHEQFP